MYTTIDQFKAFAKRLQKSALAAEPIALSSCQRVTARAFGYKDWHDIERSISDHKALNHHADVSVIAEFLAQNGSQVGAQSLVDRLCPFTSKDWGDLVERDAVGVELRALRTPSSDAIEALVARCPPGRFVTVVGEYAMGKRAAVRRLTGTRGIVTGLSARGRVVEVRAMDLDWPYSYVRKFCALLTGRALETFPVDCSYDSLIGVINDVRPALIVISGCEHFHSSRRGDGESIIAALPRIIQLSGVPWLLTGRRTVRPKIDGGLGAFLSKAVDLSALEHERYELLDIFDGPNFGAMLKRFEAVVTEGAGTCFHDERNVARVAESVAEPNGFGVMAILNRMHQLIGPNATWHSFQDVIGQVCLEFQKKKEERAVWPKVRSRRVKSSGYPKFEPFPVEEVFFPDRVFRNVMAEGSRFHFQHAGLPLRVRLNGGRRGANEPVMVQFAVIDDEGMGCGSVRIKDGLVGYNSRGSWLFLQAELDRQFLGLSDGFSDSKAEEVFPVLQRYVLPMLTARSPTLERGELSDLASLLALVSGASGCPSVCFEFQTLTTPMKISLLPFGVSKQQLACVEVLRGLIWEQFRPVGWVLETRLLGSLTPYSLDKTRPKGFSKWSSGRVAREFDRKIPNVGSKIRDALLALANAEVAIDAEQRS